VALVIATFVWGAVPAIAFSVVAEQILNIPISRLVEPAAASAIGATVVAPIAEEIFKGLALLFLFLFFREEVDSPLDGIIYGGLVGFGFAAVENVFYFADALAASGVGGVLLAGALRTFVFGLNHALFTGLTGLGMALARTQRDARVRAVAPIAGLGLGIIAHSIHNASTTVGADLCWPWVIALVADWGGATILLIVVIWSAMRERYWIVRYLAEEVSRDTLSRNDYEIVSSSLGRSAERARAIFSGDFPRWQHLGRYYRTATELAFIKHRLSRFPDDAETWARVARLRQEVRAMGRET
jgi:RsiW-degrading membrane proteinase PrsW (M82 family)